MESSIGFSGSESCHFLVKFRKFPKIGGWGCSTGKSFRFVRACVHAVWLPSGIRSQIPWAGLFPFAFGLGLVVGLFLFGLGWSWGAFPFPFWARELSLFPSPTPQTSYPTLVGLIGTITLAFGRFNISSFIVIASHSPPGLQLCNMGRACS